MDKIFFIIIFSIIFTADANPDKGPGLVFITLPAIFYEMGSAGIVFALFFFVALAFAAITSAVSMIEPAVMYLIERRGFSRKKATNTVSLIAYSLGIMAILSMSDEFSSYLTFANRNLFDWFDFITSAILMPLGGIAISIFVAFIMDKNLVRENLVPYMGEFLFKVWLFILRYLTPIFIFALMLKEIGILNF